MLGKWWKRCHSILGGVHGLVRSHDCVFFSLLFIFVAVIIIVVSILQILPGISALINK